MYRPSDSQTHSRIDTPAKSVPPRYRTLYLIFYNAVSAVLWSVVLGRVLLIGSLHGYQYVYPVVGEFTKWTQTFAGMEILHSLMGLVRASLPTTIMQVASRFLLVWGIVNTFPDATATSFAYSTMLLAWSVSEVIRYSYFAVSLAYGGNKVPDWLTWLRYNAFFVLYPLGISSECWLVWLAMELARKWNSAVGWGLWVVLAVYVPGSYVLFTHMMAQRRKIMRNSSAKKSR